MVLPTLRKQALATIWLRIIEFVSSLTLRVTAFQQNMF